VKHVAESEFRAALEAASNKQNYLRKVAGHVVVYPDLDVKTALYHHERGRIWRPTKTELESNKYKCPYCITVTLKKVRFRKEEGGYSCPRCHWAIHRDDIYDPTPKQEPEVREPGDATGKELEEGSEPFELGLDEVVTKTTPTARIIRMV
jgi:hypothetical protein